MLFLICVYLKTKNYIFIFIEINITAPDKNYSGVNTD